MNLKINLRRIAKATNDPGARQLRWAAAGILLALGSLVALLLFATPAAHAKACTFWVAPYPTGNNDNPGTAQEPWATLEHAAQTVPDQKCTVWVEEGTYYGEVHFQQRYEEKVTFKAKDPYMVILENRGFVLNFDGARNISVEGFVMRHAGPSQDKQVVKVDRTEEAWSEHITFRDNIIHDSYSDDLMKIFNGVRFVTVEDNIFFNQASREEHIDINSVTDIVVQDNIFFNDFAGSGRVNEQDTKSFITIKDSNEEDDDQLGSERIAVRRNIFLNWEGGRETFMQVGNDGKPYFEAKDVTVENNLLIGNGQDSVYAAFGVRGVQNITLTNNTIVGSLPASSYGMWVSLKDENPDNEGVIFANNIWADPTGTMGGSGRSNQKFSNGDPDQTQDLVFDNNLYWNGDQDIPPGDLVSPLEDDEHRIVADPQLETDHEEIVLPRWDGASFRSGSTSIRHEFIRLVEAYGRTQPGSLAINEADPDWAPADDILGRPRVGAPDIGAYEFRPVLTGGAQLTAITLAWSDFDESLAGSFVISYTNGIDEYVVDDISADTPDYTLKNLTPYSQYSVVVTAYDEESQVIGQSNPLVLITTDAYVCCHLP